MRPLRRPMIRTICGSKSCMSLLRKYVALLIVVFFLGIFFYPKSSFQYTYLNNELVESILNSQDADGAIINHHSSEVKIQSTPLKVCDFFNKESYTVFIAIKSYIGNFDQSLFIRRTWGKITNPRIKRIFIVGKTDYEADLLAFENNLYSDIVIGSFKEEYKNNIFKTSTIFKWITQYCMKAKYVLLVDNDYFVNVKHLVTFIDYVKILPKYPLWIFGSKCKRCTAYRSPSSKWYVSFKKYNYYSWPPYFHGGSISTTSEVMKKILTIAPYVDHFQIDDIYIGMLTQVLNIDLYHHEKFVHEPGSYDILTQVFTSHGYRDRLKLVRALEDFIKAGKYYLGNFNLITH